MKRRRLISILFCFCLILTLGSCAFLSSKVKSIKGELIGNNFVIDFYDNFGNDILTINGNKVGLEANYVKTKSVDSEGDSITNYESSSVITITVDGHSIHQTGNTVIFAEKGLERLDNFELPTAVATSGGTINILDRNINEIKNLIGTPKVVVICSQLGVPIAVYGGESVYWEIPGDLPKTTKLSIDDKALYIHRANYILLDNDLID